MKEIYILCDIKDSIPIRIKLPTGDLQIAFTNKILAEKYLEARNLIKVIKPINIQEIKLTDKMAILIEDKETTIKLLTDIVGFEIDKYYQTLV